MAGIPHPRPRLLLRKLLALPITLGFPWHYCCLCGAAIGNGAEMYAGGRGRRAHAACAEEARRLFGGSAVVGSATLRKRFREERSKE